MTNRYSIKNVNKLLKLLEKEDLSKLPKFYAEANNYLVDYLEMPSTIDYLEGERLISLSYDLLSNLIEGKKNDTKSKR